MIRLAPTSEMPGSACDTPGVTWKVIAPMHRNPSIPRTCEYCQSSFMAQPSVIKRGGGRFCSRTCVAASRRKGDCSVEGCNRPYHALGYCDFHYDRWRRNGKPETLPVKSPEERFWEKVDTTGDCWEWTGSLARSGYGQFAVKLNGKQRVVTAHRYSYLLHFGAIPNGLNVCHRCDNKRCIKPDHLFLGTDRDNVHDMIRKGRAHWQKGG